LTCTELTGDTDQSQLFTVRNGDIIITTPEKWDSMTRKWQDHRKLLDMVRLFLVNCGKTVPVDISMLIVRGRSMRFMF
jgi:ATP-dependent DNA helicase HFM1/MER3